MPGTPYLIAVRAIVFTITLALRAVPFAVLGRLRQSVIVRRPAVWMPVGILAVLAVTAPHGTITTDPHGTWYALLAVAITRRPPGLRPPHHPQRRRRHGPST